MTYNRPTVPASTAHHRALETLGSLGVELVRVDLPDLPYRSLLGNLYVEAAAVFEDLTLDHREQGLVNQAAWPDRWRQARLLSAVDYLQAERFRRQVMQAMHGMFERVDEAAQAASSASRWKLARLAAAIVTVVMFRTLYIVMG